MSEIPSTMLGWVKAEDRPDGFLQKELPVPVPKHGEVLVKTHSTSICGTDLHIWKWDEWSRANVDLGTVTGHETCGTIIGVGEGVEDRIGEQVSIECHIACWACPRCEEGNAHVCENGSIFGFHNHGAFAPYFCVPSINARTNPSDLSLPLASIQDPLGNAIHTLTGGPVEGSTIAIHGLGPIGLFSVMVAKMMGAEKIIAVDWDNKFRMDLATRLGADVVLGKDDDVVHSILEKTDGRGVDNSCEFSGSPEAIKNAIRSTRMGGYLNVLSVYGNELIDIPMNDIVFRYLHLKGINGRKMWGTWEKMHALFSAGFDPSPIITHRFPYHDFKNAMKIVSDGNCGKVILEFEVD